MPSSSSTVFTEADLREAIEYAKTGQGPQPKVTIHHPKCKAVKSGHVDDCNCGGWMYGTSS